jgi:hypothetical protein
MRIGIALAFVEMACALVGAGVPALAEPMPALILVTSSSAVTKPPERLELDQVEGPAV